MQREHFTPGPWLSGQSITAAKPGRAPGSYERTTIAQRVNRAADAWLIAAAPDMLAALQRVAGFYETAKYLSADESEILDTICAAIAKAKGEA